MQSSPLSETQYYLTINNAIRNGDLKTIKSMVDEKTDIDGKLLLHKSILYDNLQLVKFFIEKGADITVKYYYSSKDNYFNILDLAIISGSSPEIIEYLANVFKDNPDIMNHAVFLATTEDYTDILPTLFITGSKYKKPLRKGKNVIMIKDALQNAPNHNYLDMIINITLVWGGAREAFLLETADLKRGPTYSYQQIPLVIRNLIETLELNVALDNMSVNGYPRYFITTKKIIAPDSQSGVGKLLGMYCYLHEFGKYHEDRNVISIVATFYKDGKEYKKDIAVFTEVCEINKVDMKDATLYTSSKVKVWNDLFRDLNIPIRFDDVYKTIIGIDNLYKNLISDFDRKYVDENISDYVDFLDDFINPIVANYFKEHKNNYNALKHAFYLGWPREDDVEIQVRLELNDVQMLELILKLAEKPFNK